MKNLNEVEIQAALLLQELERAIMLDFDIKYPPIITQMGKLKQAIRDANAELDKDLEKLYKQSTKN